jgi:UPF0755 protein
MGLFSGAFLAVSTFEKRPFSLPVMVWIEKGMSSNKIAQELEGQGLVPSAYGFKVAQKFMGCSLKAGEYVFSGALSPYDILKVLSSGVNYQRSFLVPEGATQKDIQDAFLAHEYLQDVPTESFQEGELLPETYYYTRGESPDHLIKRMKAALEAFKASHPLPPHHPLKNWDEVIILASIVEKETGLIHEMPHVAGVFLNRLRINMPLQSDPTVLFGLNIKGREPSRQELKEESPYNTYRRLGLPLGPICFPGKSALLSVLHAKPTEDLYFVADGQGGHVFSKTLNEHQKNHALWRKKRPGSSEKM